MKKNIMKQTKSRKTKKFRNFFVFLLVIVLLIVGFSAAFNSYKSQYDYNHVKNLKVSEDIKTRAFWFSLEREKLQKLKFENKINDFNISSDGIVVVVLDDQYRYEFTFRKNTNNDYLRIYVYPIEDTTGRVIIVVSTNGKKIKQINDNDELELEKTQIDQLSKQGLELYNKFVNDYTNL